METKFSFIQETFEFLNIFQSHGFPKLSHSRPHKNLQHSKPQKKPVSSQKYTKAPNSPFNGRYPLTEIMNLSHFISVMNFRPLIFQNTHPYLLANRIEDRIPRELFRTFFKKSEM